MTTGTFSEETQGDSSYTVQDKPRFIYNKPHLDFENPLIPGGKILMLVPIRGGYAPEVLYPINIFRQAGAEVTVATVDGTPAKIEILGKILAVLCFFIYPTFSLMIKAKREKWFHEAASLQELQKEKEIAGVVEQFDAVVIPGGFGKGLNKFLNHPLLHGVLWGFAKVGKPIGLQCHGVVVGALAKDQHRKPLLRNRDATCWPRVYEKLLGKIPFLGSYLVPMGKPVQDILEAEGNRIHFRGPFNKNPQVVIDKNFYTSWGPQSADELAATLVRDLMGKSVVSTI
jgi:putative intracellular protease/amidase